MPGLQQEIALGQLLREGLEMLQMGRVQGDRLWVALFFVFQIG